MEAWRGKGIIGKVERRGLRPAKQGVGCGVVRAAAFLSLLFSWAYRIRARQPLEGQTPARTPRLGVLQSLDSPGWNAGALDQSPGRWAL